MLAHAFTGHSGLFDLYWVTFTCLSPFFWDMKVIDTQCAECRSVSFALWGVADRPSDVCVRNWMFSQVSIFVLRGPSDVLVELYSHDLIAKKRAPMSRSAMALCSGDDRSLLIVSQTLIGRHCWLLVDGSLAL